MRYRSEKRRGTVAALVALSLIPVFGVVAFAMDAGLLLDNHRRVQAAADAAALAGADDLFKNWSTNNGTDPLNKASASALSNALANRFDNDGVDDTVTVNIPPKSGSFAGKAGYVEVIIQYNQQRDFSGIFGSGNLPVQARAVACGNPGNIGILILDPTLQAALEIRGNVNLQNNGELWSNSDNTNPNDAASQGATGSVFVGPGITVTAGGINVYDSLVNQGTVNYTNGGGLNTFTTRVADPLAGIPDPTISGLSSISDKTFSSGNNTLSPGVYNNITINGGTVTMNPGLYWIKNGGSFSLNGGTLTGTGVMIVNDTQNDTVFGWNNPAAGVINLTPPTASSGGTWPNGTTSATYAGISMWVPRSWNQEVHFQDSKNATVTGTWYAQGAEFDIRANAPTAVFNIGNYICDKGEWNQKVGGGQNTGTGTININPGTAAATMRPKLVE